MNSCIVDLFKDDSAMSRLAAGLPRAFEMAALEMPKGNPAIGLLREHILIGYFINHFGHDSIQQVDDGVKRGSDVFVCEQELSIKTITDDSNVKVLWTADTKKVKYEITEGYKPDCDIFLVNIYWDRECDSIFYIPAIVQSELHKSMGKKYLHANTGTNHRGISISRDAMIRLKADSRVLKKAVYWNKTELKHSAYERWEEFWKTM